MTPFTGFTDETLAFYVGLEADNSRAYWQDHREAYERAVRVPMTALTEALAARFGPAKLFRPYRDIRFSADKSPYKTHQGAVVAHPAGAGAWYVQVSATGLTVGGGLFRPPTGQLARYRDAVAADRSGAPLATIVRRLTRRGYTLIGETLTRAPRGTDPGHPRIDLLRHKSIALTLDHGDPDWFTAPDCLDRVADGWTQLRPLLDWVGEHVGAEQ